MKRNSLATLLLICFLTSFQNLPASATGSVTNFKTLTKGCYQYTDILPQNTNNGGSQQGPQTSNLPEAYLGKQVLKVDCNLKHHLEIGTKGKEVAKGTIKLDTVLIKTKCLASNTKIANSGHESHATQLYVYVWRVGKNSNYLCGVAAKSTPHPTATGYKFYEVFYSPVLDMSK